MKLLLAIAIAASTFVNPIYGLALHGKFPGKGSYQKWVQAGKLSNEGLAAEKNGEHDKAISFFRQAIAIYPYDPDFHVNLGLSLEDHHKQFRAAEQCFRKAIQLAPRDGAFKLVLAGMFLDEGRVIEAEKEWSSARTFINTPREKSEFAKLGMLISTEKQKRKGGNNGK